MRNWKYPTTLIYPDGKRRTNRLYAVWSGMVSRCYNCNHSRYKDYGARGITVCDDWKDWDVFAEWAYSTGYDLEAPKGSCTLDRIDVNGNYAPSNCRWVDTKTQQRNKRNNAHVDGKLLVEISEEYGIPLSVLQNRYYRAGFRTIAELTKCSDAVREAGYKRRGALSLELFVEGQSLMELSNKYGISYQTLVNRYHKGGKENSTVAQLVRPPLVRKYVVEEMSLTEISNKYNINYKTVYARYRNGARTVEELTRPVRGAK